MSVLLDLLELSIQDDDLTTDMAHSDVGAVVRDCYGISWSLKLDVKELLAVGDVPDGEHGVSANSDHLSLAWMHSETP